MILLKDCVPFAANRKEYLRESAQQANHWEKATSVKMLKLTDLRLFTEAYYTGYSKF